MPLRSNAGVTVRWRRWTESLLSPALRAADVVWRARFLVECLVLGSLVAFAFSLVYFLLARPAEALATFVGAAGLAGCVVGLRWVRAYEPIAAPPPPPVLNHPPAVPLEVAPPPLRAAPVVRGRTEGELSEEEFDAVSADLWTLPDRRREILKDRGLTESSWRAYEERFGGKKAPNVGAIMQSASRRPPIAWRKG